MTCTPFCFCSKVAAKIKSVSKDNGQQRQKCSIEWNAAIPNGRLVCSFPIILNLKGFNAKVITKPKDTIIVWYVQPICLMQKFLIITMWMFYLKSRKVKGKIKCNFGCDVDIIFNLYFNNRGTPYTCRSSYLPAYSAHFFFQTTKVQKRGSFLKAYTFMWKGPGRLKSPGGWHPLL